MTQETEAKTKIKPEDWEAIGNDFRQVGKDIDFAILKFHASQYEAPAEQEKK